MRGLHVRAFDDVSIHGYYVEHSVEVNFPPRFVLAKVALTELWGEGSGAVEIVALRRRKPDGSDEPETFYGQAYVVGPDISSVTFRRSALAPEGKGLTVGSVVEVQFW